MVQGEEVGGLRLICVRGGGGCVHEHGVYVCVVCGATCEKLDESGEESRRTESSENVSGMYRKKAVIRAHGSKYFSVGLRGGEQIKRQDGRKMQV